MGRRALSPAAKFALEAAKVERKRTTEAARAKLIEDRQGYAEQIHQSAFQYAPPPPQLRLKMGEFHNWTGPVLCLGKSGAFENAGQWFRKCKGHHAGQKCSSFQWLSNPLNQEQLKELKHLWVLHDLLGSKYGQTSPSADLIRDVLSSENGRSTGPVLTNLPTPPQTQTSPIQSASNDTPFPSSLAGPSKPKRCRSLSPYSLSTLSSKRAKLHSSRLSTPSTSQATASSFKVCREVIDLSVDSDDEKAAAVKKGKGKGKGKEKKAVWMVSLGDDHYELFDSDEDFNTE